MSGFRKFLLRGNVVDLAVAVVIGAAFSAVINSFVKAFLQPLVGLATGATGDVAARQFTISGVQFPYGQFVQAMISFVIITAVIYFMVVKPVQRLLDLFKTEPEPTLPTQPCPECLSSVPVGARRCAFCTAELATV